MFVWSLLTAASGLARNFWELFVVRLGVGVGEASCAPAALSLIGDLYRTEHRARATATFMMGLPIGLGLSFSVGGAVAQQWGWRAALFVAAAPGLLCAIAALFMREPERGMVETHKVGQRRRPGSPYKLVMSIPTLWWIIVSGALHNFNMYALGAFLGVVPDSLSPRQPRARRADLDGRLRAVRIVRPHRRRHRRRCALQAAQGRPPDRRHAGQRHLRAVDVSRR